MVKEETAPEEKKEMMTMVMEEMVKEDTISEEVKEMISIVMEELVVTQGGVIFASLVKILLKLWVKDWSV